MGRYSGKTCRLLSMLALTASFFLVEIIVGYVTNSIALVADSFHMLSDVVALIVGFASIRIAKWPSRKNTYGWVRAEILGALVNAVFLLALCFSILVESLKRLVTVEEIEKPVLLLIVGVLGLVINLIGLALFHNQTHGHSHGGGMSHSHGNKRKSNHDPDPDESKSLVVSYNQTHGHSHRGGGSHSHGSKSDINLDESKSLVVTQNPDESQGPTVIMEISTSARAKAVSSAQMNMRGVFLHVLGDALGSVVVIISSLIIWKAEGRWRFYVDPAMSIAMVILILSTTIPLLKQSSMILLQTTPNFLDQNQLIAKLNGVPGVLGVHEFHIWQLAGNRIVLSAHITCSNMREYMNIAAVVKDLFHKEGIHSTTIQPEFVEVADEQGTCKLPCIDQNQDCLADTCCGTTPKTRAKDKQRKDRWGGNSGKSMATGSQSAPQQSSGSASLDLPGASRGAEDSIRADNSQRSSLEVVMAVEAEEYKEKV
ncbi:uncharacterized protein [Littorina saxatilis]|uniref:Zinc transporter 1 n=1 Tax=Littorina saxatilis TaxID=31220 RepID=A0AAN9B517_9CAEN